MPKFLSYQDLKLKKDIPWTRRHLLSLQKRGLFPRAVSIGPNTQRFIEEEIDSCLQERIAARDGSNA